nr:hypothetical protein [uncultured Ruegeria sp.]
MVFPLLMWSTWTAYSYFDGYRQSARNLKSAYAIADILSRERNAVTEQYITNLYELQKFMIADRSDVSIRISFIRYDEPDDRHYVSWSCTRGDTYDAWTDANISEIWNRIPVMADNANMIIVETEDLYTRPFYIGFGDNEFPMDNFVFTQPRGYHNIQGPQNDNECWTTADLPPPTSNPDMPDA